jgi:D-glycero-D-manno-heptose 1,7-bisphosphate phosphatase
MGHNVRTIFLDRDGVINENRSDHVKSWAEFQFLPGALAGLCLLTNLGYRIFVVTNQAVINRGLVEQSVIEQIHLRMVQAATVHGATISAVRFCPHRDDEVCGCRKPQPGLLQGLAEEYGFDIGQAIMVGDAFSDIAAGQAAGCGTTIMVRSGRGLAQLSAAHTSLVQPDHVVDDLYAAALWLQTYRQAEAHTAQRVAFAL